MSQTSRQEYIALMRGRYGRAGKPRRITLLNETCEVCGYERKYAIKLLTGNVRGRFGQPGRKRGYDDIVQALKTIWLVSDQMCGKRLAEGVPLWLPFYESHHGGLSPEQKEKLLKISPAQIDRLLAGARLQERSKKRMPKHPHRHLLDFYHVCEYLGGAAPACAPGNIQRWLTTQKKRLKANQSDRVIECLHPYLEKSSLAGEEAPVRRAHRHLSDRGEQLHYAGILNSQLPIGSGLIESGHRHVIQNRLKIAGASWTIENPERLLQDQNRKSNQNMADPLESQLICPGSFSGSDGGIGAELR